MKASHNVAALSRRASKGLGLLLAVLLVLVNFSTVWAGKQPPTPVPSEPSTSAVADEVIAMLYKSGDLGGILKDYNLELLDQIPGYNFYRFRVKDGKPPKQKITELQNNKKVVFADINYIQASPEAKPWYANSAPWYANSAPWYANSAPWYANSAPWYANSASEGMDVSPYTGQYAYSFTQADQAHQLSTGVGITVAVLDTGIDLNHPAIAPHLVAPNLRYDFVDNDAVPEDTTNGIDDDGNSKVDEGVGHGTHVAGLVLLSAPDAKIMPVRVINSDGKGLLFNVLKGIKFAADNGAKIINTSLGLLSDTTSVRALVEYAWYKGAVVVAAAGNEGRGVDGQNYPASIDKVVSVAATDPDDKIAPFSNYGPKVDISAPGVAIYSTFFLDNYAYWNGTSMATPLVSGGLALVMAKYPTLTPQQAVDRLKAGTNSIAALNPDYTGEIGTGRLNLYLPLLN